MFIWKTTVILGEFKQHLPEAYKLLVGKDMKSKALGREYIQKIWSRMPNISIDYGILEKAKNVAAVPTLDIGWSDLGSWESLVEVLSKDRQGNIFNGDIIPVNCKNTLVWGEKKVIAPVGLRNMIIVDTPDALLICPKDKSQDVKIVVDTLKAKKRREI